jgi:outer membrane lipoprotein SlyB
MNCSMIRIGCVVALAAAMVTSISCAPDRTTSANRVTQRDTGRSHTMTRGEVVYVREVVIAGEAGAGGAIAGGVLGLAVGNQFGGGRTRSLTRAAGAVGGAAAGAAIAERASEQTGVEITVELETGEVVVILQAADEVFEVGDSVRVLRRSDGQVRVVQ